MRMPVRALIVTPSEDDARTLVVALSRQGGDVDWERVATAAELRAALVRPWDVVLCDYRLPRLSAPAALRLVRQAGLDAAFFVISGAIGEENAVEMMRAGASDFFLKTNLSRLGAAVAREVHAGEQRRLARETMTRLDAERRVAEEALRVSEEKFRAFFDCHPEYCFMLSRDGQILEANRAVIERLGYDRSELVGAPVERLYGPESLPRARELLASWQLTGATRDEELVILTKDGQKRTVLLSADAVRDADGRILRSITVQRDVTERKELEASVAQADRLASMGMLAAGVAHEINNPLAYVLYNLESLVGDVERIANVMRGCDATLGCEAAALLNPAAAADVVERFNDALAGTRRIRDIARGLHTFSRVEKDRVVPVDLRQVLECALNMSYNEIKYRARIVKDYGRVPVILANDGRMSQVFLNLLVNAAHAIDEGQVDANEIRVRLWSEGEQVVAEVADSGKGILPEHLGQIFEPFFTTKGAGVGSGLGLFICRNIVTGYGGTIEVESEPGQGTRFVVRLPVGRIEDEPDVPEADPVVGQAPAVRGRVLVVDDEAPIRAVMNRLLSKEHEVVLAGSGDAARQILERDQAFDLILCDLMMPKVSGMDLHEWLSRANPELARHVVFVTGGVFTPRAQEYLGRVDCLRIEKPFDLGNLRRMAGELIYANRSRRGSGDGAKRSRLPTGTGRSRSLRG